MGLSFDSLRESSFDNSLLLFLFLVVLVDVDDFSSLNVFLLWMAEHEVSRLSLLTVAQVHDQSSRGIFFANS